MTRAEVLNASLRGLLAETEKTIDLSREVLARLKADAARAAAQGRLSSDLMRAVGMVTEPAARTEKGER